jgi:tyrosyl-tRNA synthetase
MDHSPEAVDRLLTRRVAQVVEHEALRQMLLTTDRPMRIKLGFDPTSPDLHLGHGVVLERLRGFQDLGHLAVLVVGDTTAQLGDPSERNVTRPMLTADQVRANAQTYLDQFFRVVDEQRTEVRWQSEWFGGFGLADVVRLMSRFTVARMIERDTFALRLAAGAPIAMHETLYPLLQAHDSVAVEADVELGGTDQTFNLLVGRDIQRDAGQAPQQILTCELLVGLDGEKKMSKSLGNAIGLTDPPYEQYARAMSISDELMPNWAALVTRWEDAEITAFAAELAGGSVHPKLAKQRLAAEIVSRWHGDAAASAAAARWQEEVSAGEAAADTPDHSISAGPAGLDLLDLLVGAGLARSRGEARRLVGQGGVRLDGVVLADEQQRFQVGDQHELRVGKRSAARVTLTD